MIVYLLITACNSACGESNDSLQITACNGSCGESNDSLQIIAASSTIRSHPSLSCAQQSLNEKSIKDTAMGLKMHIVTFQCCMKKKIAK